MRKESWNRIELPAQCTLKICQNHAKNSKLTTKIKLSNYKFESLYTKLVYHHAISGSYSNKHHDDIDCTFAGTLFKVWTCVKCVWRVEVVVMLPPIIYPVSVAVDFFFLSFVNLRNFSQGAYLSTSSPKLHQIRRNNFSNIVVDLFTDHGDHQLNCQLVVAPTVGTSLPSNLFATGFNVSPIVW